MRNHLGRGASRRPGACRAERSARMGDLRGPDSRLVTAEFRSADLTSESALLEPCTMAVCRSIDSLGSGVPGYPWV